MQAIRDSLDQMAEYRKANILALTLVIEPIRAITQKLARIESRAGDIQHMMASLNEELHPLKTKKGDFLQRLAPLKQAARLSTPMRGEA